MRTTVLTYVIAATGLLMVLGGTWAVFVLFLEKTVRIPWRYYVVAIGMIAGGLSMVGLAQSLRLLAAIYESVLRG